MQGQARLPIAKPSLVMNAEHVVGIADGATTTDQTARSNAVCRVRYAISRGFRQMPRKKNRRKETPPRRIGIIAHNPHGASAAHLALTIAAAFPEMLTADILVQECSDE